jgi:hypothetical protein
MLRWQREQLELQRMIAPKRRCVTKRQFIDAIQGTGGNKSLIAAKLRVDRTTVCRRLDDPSWNEVLCVYADEVERGHDRAEAVIQLAMRNEIDLPTATLNARWWLARRRPKEYGEKSTTIVEGGDKPIRTTSMNINIDALKLPVEMKRQLLEAIDAHEQVLLDERLKAEGQRQLEASNGGQSNS